MATATPAELALQRENRRLQLRIAELERERQIPNEIVANSPVMIADSNQSLRENEALLRSLFDSPEVMRGIVELVDGVIVHVSCNATAAKMYGVDQRSISGKSATEAGASEEVGQAWVDLYEQSRRTGKPVSMEYPRRDADGRERWLLATACHIGTGSSGHPRFAYTILDLTDRKRAEEAVRESEEKFRALFESIEQGFCTIEVLFDEHEKPVDYRFLMVNPAFERLTGISNATGRRMREIAPLHEEHWFQLYGRIALTGEPLRFENPATQLDRYYDVYAWRIGAPAERKVAILFNDISDRRRAEEALRESESRLRSLSEDSKNSFVILSNFVPQLVWMCTPDGLNVYFNQRWVDYTGLTLEESYGRGWNTPFHPDDQQAAWNAWNKAVQTGGQYSIECRLRAADGSYRRFLIRGEPMRDIAGGVLRWLGTCTDIEDLRQESEQQYRTLANAIPQLCWMANGDGWIFWYNERWYAYTGTTPEQMEGWGWQSVHDPETLPQVLDRWKASLATGEPFDMVFPLRGADGVFRPFLTRVMPLRDPDGKVTRWFGTNTDISEQLKNEGALREERSRLRQSEERLRLAQIRGAVGVWDWDTRTGGLHFTPELEQLYGLEPGSIKTYEDWRRLAHAGDIVAVEAERDKAIANHEPFDLEFRILHASGPVRWLAARGGALYDDAGKAVRVLGINLDITRRKHAEEALAEAMQRLNAHMDNSPMAIIEFDPQFRVTRWSNEAAKLFGWKAEEILGRAIAEIRWVHEDDVEAVRQVSQDMLDGKSPRNVSTNRNYRKDGSVIEGEWYNSAIYDAGGRLTSILSQVLDITERKRAEAALRESEGRERARAAELEALMEMTPAAIFVAHDPACRHMSGNRRAYDLLRWGRGKNISKSAPEGEEPTSFRAMKDGIEIPPAELPLQKAAATGQLVRDYAFDAVFEDGVTLNLLCDATPLLDEKGRPRGGVGVLSDVTEIKRTEQRLRESQKLESLGLLAGGVAHDFNNLLVGVVGNASLAQEMLPPSHPVAELLSAVVTTGEQAAHLTRQMLAYSGKGKFLVEPLDLSALVPEMGVLVRPSVSKKIALRFDLGQALPPIEADRGQIQQVFMNLVINAADAIGSHDGLITVGTGVERVDERYARLHPECAALQPGKYVCLAVRDTGCGMDEATKARIFDPFFSTKFIGRGLGLAAVSGIVRGHKGAIAVESAPGKGSCFTVFFPAAAHAVESPASATRTASLQGSGTILVVDDEQLVRDMAKRSLERRGYTILLADSGAAAIDIFKRHPGEIALVVLDLSMPGMSGEETLPELRKIRPAFKVVVSSGYSESEAMPLFRGQQVSGFVQKPYTPNGLAEKVKACLG